MIQGGKVLEHKVDRTGMISMATYVLVPGAGGRAWYWHRLVPELRALGHEVVAVDLPAADDSAGLHEYADTVVKAIGKRSDVILAAMSMGAFTAPIVCTRVPVGLLVLLNPMIPAPGETAAAWWDNTGQEQAMADQAAREGRTLPAEFDLETAFFHDVPPELTAEAFAQDEPGQSGTPFNEQWPLDKWPDTPTVVLQGRDDRFFPLEFQRRVAAGRLGLEVDDMPGGHLLALSRPEELAQRLEKYRARASM